MYVDNTTPILCRASWPRIDELISDAALACDAAAATCKVGEREEIERLLRVATDCVRLLFSTVQLHAGRTDYEARDAILECADFVEQSMETASEHVRRRFRRGNTWNMDALMLECDIHEVTCQAQLLTRILDGRL